MINRDPIGRRGGINLFAYVRNRPSLLIDPTGLEANDPDNPYTNPRVPYVPPEGANDMPKCVPSPRGAADDDDGGNDNNPDEHCCNPPRDQFNDPDDIINNFNCKEWCRKNCKSKEQRASCRRKCEARYGGLPEPDVALPSPF